MREKELSKEESIKLINRMIHEAKGYFSESGITALIYGFSLIVCALLAYLRDKNNITFPFHPFYLMLPVFFLQSWVYYKEEKKKKAKTFTDETIDYIWMGYFLSAIIAGCFAGGSYIMIVIFLFLQGAAAFVTGMVTKFYYHVVAGIVCLLVAGVSIYVTDANIYLLFAACAVLTWVIPGFILNRKFRQQHIHKPYIIE